MFGYDPNLTMKELNLITVIMCCNSYLFKTLSKVVKHFSFDLYCEAARGAGKGRVRNQVYGLLPMI